MLRVNNLIGFGSKRSSVVSIPSILLMHMDGSNGSTTFTDVYGHTVTANGNAQISTAQSVFGGASALFDGSGDSLQIASSADFAFGTGDFTIECFFRAPNVTTEQFLICLRNVSSSITNNVLRIGGGKVGWSNGTAWLEHSSSVSTNTWYHVAVVRLSGTLNIYLDGVSGYSATQTINLSSNRPCFIGGSDSSSQDYNGYIDEVRITKGTARYTANFTTPSSPFTE